MLAFWTLTATPDHCAPRPKENPATGRRLWRGSGPLKDDATAGATEIMLPGGPVFRPARLCQEEAGTVIASTLPRPWRAPTDGVGAPGLTSSKEVLWGRSSQPGEIIGRLCVPVYVREGLWGRR